MQEEEKTPRAEAPPHPPVDVEVLNKIKDDVLATKIRSLRDSPPFAGMYNLLRACKNELFSSERTQDDLLIPPPSETAISIAYGSITAAIRYAMLISRLIEPNPEVFFAEQSFGYWTDAVAQVINNPASRTIFQENIWRLPQVVIPERGASAGLLLGTLFGDRKLKGIDFGAGLHLALPWAAKTTPQDAWKALGWEKGVGRFPTMARIDTALGIELQQPDLWWNMASLWPIPANQKNWENTLRLWQETEDNRRDKFPLRIGNLLSAQEILKTHPDLCDDSGHVDFIFASFVVHQLGMPDHQEMLRVVGSILVEGGAFITLGEILPKDATYLGYPVRVYTKQQGRVRLLSTPWVLGTNQSQIAFFNPFGERYPLPPDPDYFGEPLGRGFSDMD